MSRSLDWISNVGADKPHSGERSRDRRRQNDGREIADQASRSAERSCLCLFHIRNIQKSFGELIKKVGLKKVWPKMAAQAEKAGMRRGDLFAGIEIREAPAIADGIWKNR